MSLASSGDDRGHPDAAATHNGAASGLRRRQRGGGLPTQDRDEAYGFVPDALDRFGYRGLGKRDKGVVLRFLVAATGLSLKQMERLVRQWRETG